VKEIEKRDEEEWQLKDVIFVDDNKVTPVGRVIKVDGSYVAVKMLNKGEPEHLASSKEDLLTLFQECRLFRKDEVQLIKYSMASRSPEWLQQTPKLISLPDKGQQSILSFSVDADCKCLVLFPCLCLIFKLVVVSVECNKSCYSQPRVSFTGVQLLCRNGSKLNYIVYNIGLNKIQQDHVLPTDASAFLGIGKEQRVQLQSGGEVCLVLL
jgi:E3 ubiquitin-protein ligase EDD1